MNTGCLFVLPSLLRLTKTQIAASKLYLPVVKSPGVFNAWEPVLHQWVVVLGSLLITVSAGFAWRSGTKMNEPTVKEGKGMRGLSGTPNGVYLKPVSI